MRVWANTLVLCAVVTGAACDTTPRGRDAAAQTGQRIAEVFVRLDGPNGGSPSVSVRAFRATVNGASPDEVLAAIDALVTQPPEGACALRDVAGAARALGAQGGQVELDALSGLSIELGQPVGNTLDVSEGLVLRPTPRVYANLASSVGGVVSEAEAGPLDLETLPTVLSLGDAIGRFPIPAMPRLGIATVEAGLLPSKVSIANDLSLSVTGPAQHTGLALFVELRPFGATWALACPLVPQPGSGVPQAINGAGERVVVPVSWLARLADLKVPVSIEAVARESQAVQIGTGGASVRLTLEVRSSSVVELVP